MKNKQLNKKKSKRVVKNLVFKLSFFNNYNFAPSFRVDTTGKSFECKDNYNFKMFAMGLSSNELLDEETKKFIDVFCEYYLFARGKLRGIKGLINGK